MKRLLQNRIVQKERYNISKQIKTERCKILQKSDKYYAHTCTRCAHKSTRVYCDDCPASNQLREYGDELINLTKIKNENRGRVK